MNADERREDTPPSEEDTTLAETVHDLSGGLGATTHRPGSSEFVEDKAPSEDEGTPSEASAEEGNQYRVPQDDKSGVNAIMGTWPGQETDAEVKEALETPRPSDEELGRAAMETLNASIPHADLRLLYDADDLQRWGAAIRAKLARRGELGVTRTVEARPGELRLGYEPGEYLATLEPGDVVLVRVSEE